VTVTISLVDEKVTLAVHNRGLIPAEDLPVIFDPLSRGLGRIQDDADKMSMGLGLYITREIAKAHGGEITVESDAEKGTVFTVSLPRYQPYVEDWLTGESASRPVPPA
jgi:signal transduction histidine kinase